MANDPNHTASRQRERYHQRWLSWLTLLAGAAMCGIALLLS
jgi:hypothetical protein